MSELSTTDRTYVQRMTGIGAAEAVYTNDELDEFYTDAGADKAETVLLVLYALLADASKLYDYRLAQSSESQSQVFKHLQQLVGTWEKKTGSAAQQVQIEAMRSVPPKNKQEPST